MQQLLQPEKSNFVSYVVITPAGEIKVCLLSHPVTHCRLLPCRTMSHHAASSALCACSLIVPSSAHFFTNFLQVKYAAAVVGALAASTAGLFSIPQPHHDVELYNKAQSLVNTIARAAWESQGLQSQAEEAFWALSNQKELRNALFNLPTTNSITVPSIDDCFSFFLGPLSPYPTHIPDRLPGQALVFQPTPLVTNKVAAARARTNAMTELFESPHMGVMLRDFPRCQQLIRTCVVNFGKNIFGVDVLNGLSHVNMRDIRYRLAVAETSLRDNPNNYHALSADHGNAWVVEEGGVRQAIVEIQGGMAVFLRELAARGYLDIQAGVASADSVVPAPIEEAPPPPQSQETKNGPLVTPEAILKSVPQSLLLALQGQDPCRNLEGAFAGAASHPTTNPHSTPVATVETVHGEGDEEYEPPSSHDECSSLPPPPDQDD
jgi:hypothetical protein